MSLVGCAAMTLTTTTADRRCVDVQNWSTHRLTASSSCGTVAGCDLSGADRSQSHGGGWLREQSGCSPRCSTFHCRFHCRSLLLSSRKPGRRTRAGAASDHARGKSAKLFPPFCRSLASTRSTSNFWQHLFQALVLSRFWTSGVAFIHSCEFPSRSWLSSAFSSAVLSSSLSSSFSSSPQSTSKYEVWHTLHGLGVR